MTADSRGTLASSDQHAFAPAALETWLRRHLPGFEGPLSVERFSGGQSNPTYKLLTPDATYVMRSKPAPAARLLPSAHAIDREFRVMRALASTDVPVPRVHLLCDDESVIGRAFYVMEFIAGRVLWDPALPDMTRGERAAIHDETNRVLAALHSVDPAAVGLADYGRPGNYFERQINRWTRQYRASQMRSIPAMDCLIDWLPSHIPLSARDDARARIVHGDYRLDNLIFHPHEPRALAVLDWELSTLGHPLADLSYLCMAWHIPREVRHGLSGLDLKALGIPSERAYLQRYGERTGHSAEIDAVMADWPFYLAYNLFRLAAILEGVAKRELDGTASSASAAQAGALGPVLADLAWAMARDAGR